MLDQVETTKFRPTVQISDSGTELMAGKLPADMPSMMPDLLVRTLTSRLRGKVPHVREEQDDSIVMRSPSDADDADEDNEDGYSSDEAALEDDAAYGSDQVASEGLNKASPETISAKVGEDDGLNETTAAPTQTIERHDSAESSIARPNFYWTWKLLSEGYSVSEVEQVRNVDQQTVLEHTLRAAEDDLTVEPGWVLTATKQTFLRQFVDQHSDQRPAGLLSKLPAGVSSNELLLFLACRSK